VWSFKYEDYSDRYIGAYLMVLIALFSACNGGLSLTISEPYVQDGAICVDYTVSGIDGHTVNIHLDATQLGPQLGINRKSELSQTGDGNGTICVDVARGHRFEVHFWVEYKGKQYSRKTWEDVQVP
jgi:hypothetical protein